VLGDYAYRIPVSSTKSMIGHSLSAASLTGVIATIGAFETGMVPPTMNYEFPDPECDLDYVPNKARRHHAGTALVMASGFGGIHSGALLRAPSRPHPSVSIAQSTPSQARSSVSIAQSNPLLFLHGFGGAAMHWAPLLRELGGVDAVAVDLPGHGDNAGTPLDVDERDLTTDLAVLAEGLAAAGTAGPGGIVVVGHSLGALAALRLAAVAPHRVRALVLLATGFPFRVHPDLADQLASGDGPDRAFLAGCLKRPDANGTLDLLADGFRRMRTPIPATGVWGVALGEDGPEDLLAAIRVPTLVIVAGDDVVTSPRKGRALAAALPDAELVVLDGAGHYAHMEDAPQVAGHIRGFLARVASRRRAAAAEVSV
jgi:pimeloyl-ACP methyl ester carboxylesterase